MESQGDEAVPKRSKPRNPAHFPTQDSVLPMPNLPAELVTEVLLKLPVKSLLQFRCVSKSWLSLICSPDFVKTHLLLSPSNKDYTHHGVLFNVGSTPNHGVTECSLSSLLYHPVTEAFDLDYPGESPNDYPWLVGSVNGLICLAISPLNRLYELFQWNPSIRKYKKLRKYRLHLSRYNDDEPGDFKFGFAYDELQDDYKVVGIFPIYRYGGICRVEVKIYSLRSNSWRRISDFQGREFSFVPGKLVNGKLHWLEKGWNISSIDLGNEKWVEIEKPCNFKEYGHLVLGVLGSDPMKEYGIIESWTKMFTIKSPDDFRSQICLLPILVSNEGDILLIIGSR